MISALMLAALAGGTGCIPSGGVIEWANASNGNWNVPENWIPQNVPDASDEAAYLGLTGAYTVFLNMSPTIQYLDVANPDARLHVYAGTMLSLTSGVFNDGTILLPDDGGTSADSILRFVANGNLDGSGVLRMEDPNDSILTESNGSIVTHGAGHTISGRGYIYAPVVNDGLIVADINTSVLNLDSPWYTNRARMQAAGGGFLDIGATTVTQALSGIVRADAGTVLLTSNSSIVGGLVDTANGGLVRRDPGTTTLTDVMTGGSWRVQPGGTLQVNGSGLTNNGVILLPDDTGTSADSILRFVTHGTLGGTGTLRMEDPLDSILSEVNGSVIAHGRDHTISGRGSIYAPVVNDGIIAADINTSILHLDSPWYTNRAVLKATGGGVLDIGATTLTQDAGVVRADAGTVLMTSNNTIAGGLVESIGGGLVQRDPGTTTLTDVTADGDWRVQAGGVLQVNGAGLTNNGFILLPDDTGTGADSVLRFVAHGTLGGTGTLRMEDPNDSILSEVNGAQITHASTHTISGRGWISVFIVNHGLIVADWSTSALYLDGPGYRNFADMRAVANGVLQIANTTVTQEPAGVIRADAATVLLTSNSSIVGGLVDTANGGLVRRDPGTTTLTDVMTGGSWRVQPGGTLQVNGSGLTNNGVILLPDDTGMGADSILRFVAHGTLGGTGVLRMEDPNDAILTESNGAVITHAASHTISGRGFIYAPIVNHGRIAADINTSVLHLDSPGYTNFALMEAVAGGVLDIGPTTLVQDAEGVVRADAATVLLTSNNTIAGGLVESINAGLVQRDPGTTTLTDVTADGSWRVQPSGTLQVNGSGLTNNGVILLPDDTGTGADSILRFIGHGTLGGTGTLRMEDPNDAFLSESNGSIITHGPGHTISGVGTIAASLVNRGTLAPGSAAVGTLKATRPIAMQPTSFFDVELASAGSTDRLSSTSSVVVGGTLRVTSVGGYSASFCADHVVLTASGGVTGEFDAVEGDAGEGYRWAAVYTPTSVAVRAVCAADMTGDCSLNVFDFLAFQAAFGNEDLAADFAPPYGVLNVFDFLGFQTAFGNAC